MCPQFVYHDKPAPTDLYTLSLHDALPISFGDVTFAGGDETNLLTQGTLVVQGQFTQTSASTPKSFVASGAHMTVLNPIRSEEHTLNSSHMSISYAVFCLKKKI